MSQGRRSSPHVPMAATSTTALVARPVAAAAPPVRASVRPYGRVARQLEDETEQQIADTKLGVDSVSDQHGAALLHPSPCACGCELLGIGEHPSGDQRRAGKVEADPSREEILEGDERHGAAKGTN
jgi:hypothetical protein